MERMMKQVKFYYCAGSRTFLLDMGESSSQCRCEGLELLEANTVDVSIEKHVPVFNATKNHLTVRVGSQSHPMSPEHYIEWIFVQTTAGGIYRKLLPGDQPEACFPVKRKEVLGVYAYCNLHGLWKAGSAEAWEFNETAYAAPFFPEPNM